MNAQELMIGDLISMGGVIRVVTGIHDKETENGVDLITTMIPGHTFPDSNLSFRASYCYPIQITPEFLEKNGFVECVFCEGEYELQCEGYRIIIHLSSGYTRIYKGSYLPILNNQNYKFVHELQHALRLCGIEKEIVL